MDKIKCDKCDYEISKHVFKKHYDYCNGEGPRRLRKKKKRGGWNKGLTKKTDERVKRNGLKISESMKRSDKVTGYALTKEREIEKRKKLSEIAKNNELGGHTSKNKIKYLTEDGEVYLQSSYEYDVACSLDQNGIKWERPKYLIWEDKHGENHRYYPDFYLKEHDVYLDPKNDYLIKKDKEKIERVSSQNGVRVIILNKNNLSWEKILKKIKCK